MPELFRGPWPGGTREDGWPNRADGPEGDVEGRVRAMEDRIAALRREAVVAVVRQQEVEARLAPVREESGCIEREAARALERGQERLARQILHRELATLARHDSLRVELLEARRRTIQLLRDAVRIEARARQTRRAADEWTRRPRVTPARDGGRVKPVER
jgi:phage shock protein A